MRIWTRKSALIQPRTSLGKSDVSWLCSLMTAPPRPPRRRTSAFFLTPLTKPENTATTHHSQSRARSRLDRRRFLQPRPHFAAFFEIYKKIIFFSFFLFYHLLASKFCKICKTLAKVSQNFGKFFKSLKF